MMKIDYISDLHVDQWKKYFINGYEIVPTGEADVCVVAGDTGNGIGWMYDVDIELRKLYNTVLMVIGNHDLYGADLNACEYPFNSSYATVEWTAALTPLWTDFRGVAPWAEVAEQSISDFRWIKGMTANLMADLQSQSTAFLENFCDSDIWVTHWPPFLQSIHPKYAGDPLNPYFVNDLEDWFFDLPERPKLIVHGHTHSPMDYMMGETRVVSNPVGYPGENQQEPIFKMKCVEVDVD